MMRTALLSASAACLAICAHGYAQAQFSGIGHLPGSTQSSATGIALDGTAVGYVTASGSPSFAVRWSQVGGLQHLGTGSGQALAISADGQAIVGEMSDGVLPRGQPFRWTAAGGIEFLGTISTFWPGGAALALSADGDVVTGWGSISNFHHRTFRWTPKTGIQNLGALPGLIDPGSVGTGISADGTVIVGHSTLGYSMAARWDSSGAEPLGTIPGAPEPHSLANGISADGQSIVGQSSSPIGYQAFRWTAAAGMTGLGLLPGREASAATAASGDGSVIVGWSGPRYTIAARQAFIWTASAGMRPVRDELIAHGATGLEGWTLTEALAISPDARWIAGRGLNPQGAFEGWVASLTGSCYANCDGSTTAPVLNVSDFACFLQQFAAASQLPHAQQLTHYANCDSSITPPVLNVADFACFLQRFAAGCP